jgi:hypothetical protein
VKSGEMLEFFNVNKGFYYMEGIKFNQKKCHAVLFGNENLINIGD